MATDVSLTENEKRLLEIVRSPYGVRSLAFATSCTSASTSLILSGAGIDWAGVPSAVLEPGAHHDPGGFACVAALAEFLAEVSETLGEIAALGPEEDDA